MILSSNDSLHMHADNKSHDFTVELPRNLNASECALGVMIYSNTNPTEELYVLCDICEESYAHNSMIPLLRVVLEPGEISNLYFVPITRKDIQRIRIRIVNEYLETPSQSLGIVHCTLLFKD